MMFRSALLAALALAAAPAAARKAPAEAPPVQPLPPAAERAALDAALARGRLLYGIDRAAWVGTDDMVERIRDYASQGIRGYIVEHDGDGFAVTFYGGPPDAPIAYYRGTVQNHRVQSRQVFAADARPALTADQRRLVAVRDAAARAVRGRPCSDAPFNSAVIPPAAPGDPVDVYFLTPQLRQSAYPFGGHYRLTVAAEGTVTGERAFTNSCLTMETPPPGPDGSRVSAIMISHLLDPVPTEIHVFMALSAQLPVMVGIGDPVRIYEVEGNGIRRLEDEPRRSRRR